MNAGLRETLGCWLHERLEYELTLRAGKLFGFHWVDLKNRSDVLKVDSRTGGRTCCWPDSSPLTVSRLAPKAGGRLLRHVLREWPIAFADGAQCAEPVVSIIVPARGLGRFAQLTASLRTFAAQRDLPVEIIVVEQSHEPLYTDRLPHGVRHVYVADATESVPFNRSRVLNAGVAAARGEFLAIVDGDMLLPERFCAAAVDCLRRGLDAVRPARFLFYLDQTSAEAVQAEATLDVVTACADVRQNPPNPIVMRRDAYLELGGHDEAFEGWGGEDNEFISRLRTLRLSEAGFLPVVHLWHPIASKVGLAANREYLEERLQINPDVRSAELRARFHHEYLSESSVRLRSLTGADA